MGKSLAELGLKDEVLPDQDLTDLPQFGGFTPPPPVGAYRFRVPTDCSSLYEPIEHANGQRIKMIFDSEHPLVIVSAQDPALINTPFETRLSSVERKRGKEGPTVSDLDYFLAATLGVKSRPKTSKAYVQQLQTTAGKEFNAKISYSWMCSDTRPIYARAAGGGTEKIENQMGCGAKYYENDAPKGADGKVPYEITCQCGAVLRAFANLDNIKA